MIDEVFLRQLFEEAQCGVVGEEMACRIKCKKWRLGTRYVID